MDRLPSAAIGYDYTIEFKHHSWETGGLYERLMHYLIAAVMTDSLGKENLQYLSEITAEHSLIRFDGRNTPDNRQ